MSSEPVALTLLNRVQARLRTVSFARSLHRWTLGGLIVACVAVLIVRLAGLLPPDRQRPEWLLVFPATAALAAWLFHRRVEQTAAARAVDQHAKVSLME